MPRTRAGRQESRAMSPMGRDDVLLANTQSFRVAASTSASTRRLRSRSSNTASMTRSDVPEAGVVDAGGEPVHARRELVSGEAAPLEPLVEHLARVAQAAAEGLEGGVLEAHGHARLGPAGRDARAHEPRPHHAQLVDLAGLRAFRIARVLLDLLRREEDRHQRARDLGDAQLAEALGLELQALLHGKWPSPSRRRRSRPAAPGSARASSRARPRAPWRR